MEANPTDRGPTGNVLPTGVRWSSVRETLPALLIVSGAVAAVLGVLAAMYLIAGITPMRYLDEPAHVLRGSAFAGSVATLGNILWFASATALLTAAFASTSKSAQRTFLLVLGAASLILGFDDTFMIHDRLLKHDWGISEVWLTGPYALAAAWLAARHWRLILNHRDAIILVGSLGLLALAWGIDFVPGDINGKMAAEESFKFAGIALWTLFAVRASVRFIRGTAAIQESSRHEPEGTLVPTMML